MSPLSQSDTFDRRGEVAAFLHGLGFRHDASGSAGRRPGRFVIWNAEHGPMLAVSADVRDADTTVVEVTRPGWACAPDGGELWLRELARDMGGQSVLWARTGRRTRVEVPTTHCTRFLKAWVLQEFGWAWHAMARITRKEG